MSSRIDNVEMSTWMPMSKQGVDMSACRRALLFTASEAFRFLLSLSTSESLQLIQVPSLSVLSVRPYDPGAVVPAIVSYGAELFHFYSID